MSFTVTEFNQLYSWAWRNIGVRQKIGPFRALYRNGGASGSPRDVVRVKFDPAFTTGCWAYNGGRHEIIVGGEFTSHLTARAQANSKHQMEAYRSLVRHEAAHGLYTSRTEDVVEGLRKEGLPFPIYNLFEDAAIEERARLEPDPHIDPAARFRWKNWVNEAELCASASTVCIDKAINWFALLTHREAASYKSLGSAERGMVYTGPRVVSSCERKTRMRIRYYYRKATKRSESFDLVQLVKEWCREFGIDTPKGLHGGNKIGGQESTPTESGDGEQGGAGEGAEGKGGKSQDGGVVSTTFDPKTADLSALEEAAFDHFIFD